MMIAALWSDSGALSQAASTLGSVARMGHATAHVMEASATLFSNTTAAAALAAATTLDVLDEMWRGVELADLDSQRHEGAFLAFDGWDCAAWLDAEGETAFPHLGAEARLRLITLLRHVGADMPFVEERGETFAAQGKYATWFVAIRLLPTSFVGVRWVLHELTFVPRWSNPFWGLLGLPLHNELQQLLKHVGAALRKLQPPQWDRSRFEYDPQVATVVRSPLPSRARFLLRHVRAAASKMLRLPG